MATAASTLRYPATRREAQVSEWAEVRITDGVVSIFDAGFARIWVAEASDRCDSGCLHATISKGPHVCCQRDRCLHLLASSGRYTHTDGKAHCRVPFGRYEIGRVAFAKEPGFLTNDILNDPCVHDHAWAQELGLVSFAGCQILSPGREPVGVLALFSKHTLSPQEDALLASLANTAAQVIQVSGAEEERGKAIVELRRALENIKTLQGIIPICAHCKKKRDDKGYWHQVEVYLRDHSEAEFSHGLCVECIEKYVPDKPA